MECIRFRGYGWVGSYFVSYLQIGAGFEQTLGFSDVLALQTIIVLVTVVAYMLSAATPINRGVVWLSNISTIVGAFPAIYFLFVGPTVTSINAVKLLLLPVPVK